MSEKRDINEDDYVELFNGYKVNKNTGQLINPKGKSIKTIIPGVKKRNYDHNKDNMKNIHRVKVTNTANNEVIIYKSLYAASKDLNLNASTIKNLCEKKENGIFIINNVPHKFEYTTEEPTKQVTRQFTVYNSDDERAKAKNERQRKYNKERMKCECGSVISKGAKYLHKQSKRHQEYLKTKNDIQTT